MDETKKYIIEFSEDPHTIRLLKLKNGDKYPVTEFKTVTPYTEPDLEQVKKEAFEEGKKQAKVQAELDVCHDIEKVAKANYQQGLNDIWAAARKIHRMPDGDILDLFPDCYASVCTAAQVILKYDASEVIAKIKEYEDGKQEIKVGDEVITASGNAVVTGVGPVHFEYDNADGSHGFDKVKNVKKTGRHFPEIAEVLRKMKETEC